MIAARSIFVWFFWGSLLLAGTAPACSRGDSAPSSAEAAPSSAEAAPSSAEATLPSADSAPSSAEATLPELGKVGPFALTDQAGERVDNATLAGEPWVAAFMFTRCPTVCPRITAEMKKLQAAAKQKGVSLHWVSFSVDPEHDTPKVLRDYARTHGLDLGNWSLLTGDLAAIKKTSVDSFKLALDGTADPNKDHLGILHGSHLVLVDAAGTIRGYYATNDPEALKKLLVDAARLPK